MFFNVYHNLVWLEVIQDLESNKVYTVPDSWISFASFYDFIVKIDSRTRSFCFRHYVQNGLSYSGEELDRCCVKWCQASNLASDLENQINISCYTESQALRLHKFTIICVSLYWVVINEMKWIYFQLNFIP